MRTHDPGHTDGTALAEEVLPFLSVVSDLFHRKSLSISGYLFGSAATNDWIAGRSDLDLLVLVPEENLGLVKQQINEWHSVPGRPLLDGFVVFLSGKILMAKRFDDFDQSGRPVDEVIQIIDLWNIRNRSRHLFGIDFVKMFPEISLSQLSEWAREELKRNFGSSHSGEIPNVDLVLSELVWSVSWSARMLMLARGMVCASKRDALRWLAQEHPEVRDSVELLLRDYYKTDEEPTLITSDQSLILRRFCFELMLLEIGAPKK